MDSPNLLDAQLPWRLGPDDLRWQLLRARPVVDAANAWLNVALQPLGDQQTPLPRLSAIFGEITRK
jgi:hypothetical protein